MITWSWPTLAKPTLASPCGRPSLAKPTLASVSVLVVWPILAKTDLGQTDFGQTEFDLWCLCVCVFVCLCAVCAVCLCAVCVLCVCVLCVCCVCAVCVLWGVGVGFTVSWCGVSRVGVWFQGFGHVRCPSRDRLSREPPFPRPPFPGPPFPWTAQNFALFFPLRHNFLSFLLSLGVLSWNFGGVQTAGALKCARFCSPNVHI